MFRRFILGILEEELHPVLEVKLLFDDAIIPRKGSDRAAGYDLHAYSYASITDGKLGETSKLDDDVELVIAGNSRCLIKTGISIAVPEGCYGRVAPRSGLALNNGVNVGAGVIDEDYRGEIGVVIFNISPDPFEVKRGDRIAQLICERIVYPVIEKVDELDTTGRGCGGFGSSGTN